MNQTTTRLSEQVEEISNSVEGKLIHLGNELREELIRSVDDRIDEVRSRQSDRGSERGEIRPVRGMIIAEREMDERERQQNPAPCHQQAPVRGANPPAPPVRPPPAAQPHMRPAVRNVQPLNQYPDREREGENRYRRDDEYRRDYRDPDEPDLRGLKLTIPSFKGTGGPDEFLDWLDAINLVFELHSHNDITKIRLAVNEFRDYALTWWQNHNRL